MTPRGYMLLGAFAGIVSAAISFSLAGFNPVLIFAAGALFGKGYGVWEERGRAALREEKAPVDNRDVNSGESGDN